MLGVAPNRVEALAFAWLGYRFMQSGELGEPTLEGDRRGRADLVDQAERGRLPGIHRQPGLEKLSGRRPRSVSQTRRASSPSPDT